METSHYERLREEFAKALSEVRCNDGAVAIDVDGVLTAGKPLDGKNLDGLAAAVVGAVMMGADKVHVVCTFGPIPKGTAEKLGKLFGIPDEKIAAGQSKTKERAEVVRAMAEARTATKN